NPTRKTAESWLWIGRFCWVPRGAQVLGYAEEGGILLQSYAERYRADLLKSVIPFWLKHAPDREFGGYFTCLDRDGSVYDTRKYVWMQGRMVWMFSKLYNELEQRPEWLDMATLGVDFIRR